jgi:hypothetical protein
MIIRIHGLGSLGSVLPLVSPQNVMLLAIASCRVFLRPKSCLADDSSYADAARQRDPSRI